MPSLTPEQRQQEQEDRLARHILREFRQEVSESFAELRELLDLSTEESRAVRGLFDESVDTVVQAPPLQSHYTPTEAARLLERRPYTVREWCRLKRIHATKRPTGRGDSCEWEISHEEIERIKSHGLLPPPDRY